MKSVFVYVMLGITTTLTAICIAKDFLYEPSVEELMENWQKFYFYCGDDITVTALPNSFKIDYPFMLNGEKLFGFKGAGKVEGTVLICDGENLTIEHPE